MKTALHIPGLSVEEVEKLRSVFATEPGILEVVLYGSRAKGNNSGCRIF
jgi:predicted nucleotidyltransferase